MLLRELTRPWTGPVLRHIAAGSPRSILDDTWIGHAPTNRWNEAGTPTYYFAVDVGVTIAEYARHLAGELPDGVSERLARSLWKVNANLESVLDLTEPAIVAAAGAGPINDWILDLDVTRKTATYLRAQVERLQALLVPSVAFLDQPARFNLVVYRDRIDLSAVFDRPEYIRDFVLEGVGRR